MDRLAPSIRRIARGEGGLGKLEVLGLIAVIALFLAMVPFVREGVQDLVGLVFNRTEEATGEITAFSQMMRGIFFSVGAVIVFVGSGWLILSTNIGKHLAFLIVGSAVFGWMTMSGILFIVFAPRGIRPASLEGLNAFQIRIPAIALALGAFILFIMFIMALDRYEKDHAPATDSR